MEEFKEDVNQYSPEIEFKPLMVLTACVVALAHGSNDVSNAIGPFKGILTAYQSNSIPAK